MKYALLVLLMAATAGLQSSTQTRAPEVGNTRSTIAPASLILAGETPGALPDHPIPPILLAQADEPDSPLANDAAAAPAGDSVPAEAAPSECDGTATTEDVLAAAREMFLADNHALAEKLYKCILRRDPNNLSAILELSVVYEAMGKLQYAKGLISRAAILKPDDKEIIDRNDELSRKLSNSLRREVDSLMTARAFDSALPKLSVLLAAEPGDDELLYKKALCYLSLDDLDGAFSEIEKALRMKQDPRYTALRSEIASRRGTVTGARARGADRSKTSERPVDRERELARVSEILSRDPQNEEAKKEFLRLTSRQEGSAAGTVPGDDRMASERRRNAVAAVVSLIQRAGAAIERHLVLILAALLAYVIFRSPVAHMIIRGFEPRQFLSGRLRNFNIQEILSVIHSQGQSGVLRIYSPAARGRIYFNDGEIFHCASGKLKGREAVRHLLSTAKDGHFVLTKLPRAFKRTIDLPFSLVLMDVPQGSAGDRETSRPDDTPTSLHKKSKMKSLLENKV
jgi:tetratricopeptide (TPR) repeat protein